MDRAQAHTLEAITAAMILVSSLVFALQVTAVTPLTGSTSSQHIENQQAAVAEGVLASADEEGTLLPTLLYWNESAGTWHGATDDGYVRSGPPTAFGSVLNETFLDRGIAFDLTLYYIDDDGERQPQPIVDLGQPSDHASSARRLVTLSDDDHLRDPDGSVSSTTLSNASYPVDDADPTQQLYTVVEVELVVWRI
ncbi:MULTISPECIES: hypothetical protein [Halobellus]|uniref:DUF7288 family protein n=1 Tax=Halobellus TaxID=1073986 RepID=UPI00210DBB1F|nr:MULTISPECIES: hypothetical protein [Halobellus]MDQ2052999.1 hypothetical protein [Halobellus sp. H-GB7]